jgi:nitroimidazol reductase NimA-like FMN-containing flavoprotein (pyridoxamine 5'-phosphate oxidase superfamily)
VSESVWIEHLTFADCWARLATTTVARLGVLVDSAPEIYPINFRICGDTLVFRTDTGTKLRAIERSPSVCIEADALDPDRATGWSVLVKGRAVEVTEPRELDALQQLPLTPWGIGEKSHWIRVVTAEITGRCIRRGVGDDLGVG